MDNAKGMLPQSSLWVLFHAQKDLARNDAIAQAHSEIKDIARRGEWGWDYPAHFARVVAFGKSPAAFCKTLHTCRVERVRNFLQGVADESAAIADSSPENMRASLLKAAEIIKSACPKESADIIRHNLETCLSAIITKQVSGFTDELLQMKDSYDAEASFSRMFAPLASAAGCNASFCDLRYCKTHDAPSTLIPENADIQNDALHCAGDIYLAQGVVSYN